MTNSVETIEDERALQVEPSRVPLVEAETHRQTFDVEFLDDEWAREFDRRLAAWESESPSPVPKSESLARE